MARLSAVTQHREATSAARAAGTCYRCGSPAAIRLLTVNLDLYAACLEHGRTLWTNLGGAKADGRRWTWWAI